MTMPRYSYIAKSLKGEEKSGIAEAKDARQLARTLKNQGFILIKAFPKKEKSKKRKLDISIPFLSGVSLAEKLMFTRNLQVMISSGLPLPRTLQTLADQTKNEKFKKAIFKIREKVIKGNSFSDCLTAHSDIFSELFQNMIKVGEETGNLDEVLNILSQQMEREHELKAKIKGALVYPAVIILTMIGIGILMLVMVIPKIAETFEELGIELPLTTRAVIGLGTFLTEKWYLAILIIIGLFFLFLLILRTKKGKEKIDSLLLKLPIISSLIKKTNSAYTIRTLSSLITAGVPIVRSLEIVSGVLGNIHYKTAISQAAKRVRRGEKLSKVFEDYKNIYPIVVLQMIKVGEETGETSSILAKLATFFEEEVGNATKNLASVIEPVLMLIIGVVIGFFAISMIQPMYSMLGAI